MDMEKETKKAITVVKRRLWNWGYRVTETTKIPGVTFHLLVNDKYRVFVRPAGGPSAFIPKDCDVIAVVTPKAVTYLAKGVEETMRPQLVMDIEK